MSKKEVTSVGKETNMTNKIVNDDQQYDVEIQNETPKVTFADIVRKLTSRKFWISVATLVFLLMVYCGADENSATQIVAIIMAGATAFGYLIGEGLADSGSSTTEVHIPGVTYPEFEETTDETK